MSPLPVLLDACGVEQPFRELSEQENRDYGELPLKAYETLTACGQERRLRRVAEAALELYDLEVVSLQLVARATNLIYRVRSSDGLSFALRLASPGWRTRSDL